MKWAAKTTNIYFSKLCRLNLKSARFLRGSTLRKAAGFMCRKQTSSCIRRALIPSWRIHPSYYHPLWPHHLPKTPPSNDSTLGFQHMNFRKTQRFRKNCHKLNSAQLTGVQKNSWTRKHSEPANTRRLLLGEHRIVEKPPDLLQLSTSLFWAWCDEVRV